MSLSNASATNDVARSEILSRIRKGLGRAAAGAAPEPRAPRVIRADIEAAEVIEQFKAKAGANLFQLHILRHMGDVPAAVAKIARDHNIGADVSIAPGLAGLGWPATLRVQAGKARIEEKLTVVRATAGIAETGTLVLCSGDDAPSSLTFAGETSIIVVTAADIVPYLEDGLARVKAGQVTAKASAAQAAHPADWPRAVNLVSGPSRTADIAGIVVRPAHGPKAVHVLVVG